jgi:hypothetical protein
MIVNNETFFVVQTPEDDYIVGSEDEAIDQLKDNSDDIDPETDDVTVAQVNYSGNDWEIKELPWQTIALQLLQG